jgi:hypothetical protein
MPMFLCAFPHTLGPKTLESETLELKPKTLELRPKVLKPIYTSDVGDLTLTQTI